jgi:spectinomycin phosphotransferase
MDVPAKEVTTPHAKRGDIPPPRLISVKDMREQPDLPEAKITACLHTHYGLDVTSIRFLPIGYDPYASVYEAITAEGVSCFVKIRSGAINRAGLLVPRVLSEHGIPNILAPLRTVAQELWCSLDAYSVIVYPFIRGENAMAAGLSDSQWREFGATLKAVHSGGFAALLRGQVPEETFSLPSAQLVRHVSARIDGVRFDSPAAARCASFWADNTPLIQRLLARAEALGKQLQSRPFEHVLCHADIHAANILVSEEGRIYLVDWDGPLLAPRERDLLFVVGSKIARPVEPREEELFFQSYGAADIDPDALAYYRYERAIEDIGEAGKSVFLNAERSEETRAEETAFLLSLFHPGNIVEAALEADRKGHAS